MSSILDFSNLDVSNPTLSLTASARLTLLDYAHLSVIIPCKMIKIYAKIIILFLVILLALTETYNNSRYENLDSAG